MSQPWFRIDFVVGHIYLGWEGVVGCGGWWKKVDFFVQSQKNRGCGVEEFSSLDWVGVEQLFKRAQNFLDHFQGT